jgi:hypothetical protein
MKTTMKCLQTLVAGALTIGLFVVHHRAVAAEPPPAQEEPVAEEPLPEDIDADETEAEEEALEEEEEEEEEEEVEYRNWFDVSVGSIFLDGRPGRFQRRYGVPEGVFGGVEEFHYEQDVGPRGLFTVDGRGIFDHGDYELRFDLTDMSLGYVRGGYREFRSYFDSSGGFFRPTGAWLSLHDDTLRLERGEAWFEAGLTLPNWPTFVFRYSHQFQDGRKDSTAWGEITIPGYGLRSIVPSFREIDQTRDRFQADARHTLGSTDLGLGLRYEISNQEHTLNLRRNPGETRDRFGTQRDRTEIDLFSVHAFSTTRFHEKVLFTTGYAFTTLDSDISGYRLYGTAYDPIFAQRLPNPDTFEHLSGGSQLHQHVANVNLMLQLTDNLVLVPALRIEQQSTDSESFYDSPAAPFSSFAYGAGSDRALLDVSESLDLRFTGLTNWVFYARGHWLQGSGDLNERWNNLSTGALVLDRSTDDRRFWQKYTVGANWYPLRRLNFGAQYYHKRRKNDFEHGLDAALIPPAGPFRYPAFLTAQEFTTDDINFRVTWRPHTRLSLVGRYDFQLSTIDTRPADLPKIQTSDLTSHILSGTLSWTPVNRLYLQGGVNRVWDRTDTPADAISPAIHVSRNDYWTVNSTIGYALDDKSDLELQYLYYRADNFVDNSAFGLPYGTEDREHGITAALIRRISERMRVTLKYGFFDGRFLASGHHQDYQAHLIYSSLRYRF